MLSSDELAQMLLMAILSFIFTIGWVLLLRHRLNSFPTTSSVIYFALAVALGTAISYALIGCLMV